VKWGKALKKKWKKVGNTSKKPLKLKRSSVDWNEKKALRKSCSWVENAKKKSRGGKGALNLMGFNRGPSEKEKPRKLQKTRRDNMEKNCKNVPLKLRQGVKKNSKEGKENAKGEPVTPGPRKTTQTLKIEG